MVSAAQPRVAPTAARPRGAAVPTTAKDPVTTEAPRPTTPPAPVDDDKITAAEFAAIQTGMSRAEVTAIIGSPGTLLSESTIAGHHTEVRMWEGDGVGANANVMFQDNAVVSKAQFGL